MLCWVLAARSSPETVWEKEVEPIALAEERNGEEGEVAAESSCRGWRRIGQGLGWDAARSSSLEGCKWD